MSNQKVIILLGAPGSGKGTLSRLCVENFGWKHFSTGNLCRKHVSEGTELGKQIDFAMKSGTLVSDQVIIEIVAQWIDQEIKESDHLILDGSPRTVVQAEGLMDFLIKKHSHVKLVIIELRVPDHEIIERLSSRLMCTNQNCQAFFSSRTEQLKPRNSGLCDFCNAPLTQRNDDKQEVVKSRLETYHRHCDALIHYYKNIGYVVHVIDGDRGSVGVFEKFLKHVDA